MRIMVEEVRYTAQNTPFVGTLTPYLHQARTLDAVRTACQEQTTVCLLNTSMTGSGKTLANFAAAILDGTPTCGIYPTNELLLDQYGSLRKWISDEHLAILDSEGLDAIQAELPYMKSHAHALAWATGTYLPTAVCTNPDVLYLAMYHLYGQMFSTFARSYGARAFHHLLTNYPVIAFDEFHLYNAKQVANAAFIMGTIKELAPDLPHIFIFSSATPHTPLFPYLDRLNLVPVDVTAGPAPTGCIVCEEVEINFLPADLEHWRGGEALAGPLQDILDWADATDPQARGVFIVDSVYEAKMLAALLRERYPGDQVGEVHGYMDPTARSEALRLRLSVGTTTIDVGVNLVGPKRKDFLVGEARSADQAMQRIGRIGRRGREHGQIDVPNRIWLAVPDYVYTYLAGRARDGATITREQLGRLLKDAYLGNETFAFYPRRYSPLEAVAGVERVLADDFSDTRPQKERRLHRLVPTLYAPRLPGDEEQAEKSYQDYRRAQQEVWVRFGKPIEGAAGRFFLSDLESFRGGLESDFVVALYDELDEAIGFKPVKVYTLPFVLRRTCWEEMSKQAFSRMVTARHPAHAEQWLQELDRQRNILGYLHVTGLVEGKANVVAFEALKSAIAGRFRQVIRLSGLGLYAQGGTLLTTQESILGRLGGLSLNCWVSQASSFALARAQPPLPPLFAVYPLRARALGGKPSEWSIAFGLDAFFLDSVYR